MLILKRDKEKEIEVRENNVAEEYWMEELYFCFFSGKNSKSPNAQLSYIVPRAWAQGGRSHSLLMFMLPALSTGAIMRVENFAELFTNQVWSMET